MTEKTNSRIIDGVNKNGQRCSASMPGYMFDLFVWNCSESNPPIPKIRQWLREVDSGYSSYVQRKILREIAKPSLVQKWDKACEVQIDIEDQ